METIQGIKTGLPEKILSAVSQVRSQNGFHVVYQRSVNEYINYDWQSKTSEFYLPRPTEPGYTFSMLAYANGPSPRFSIQLNRKSDEWYYAYITLRYGGKEILFSHRTGQWDLTYPWHKRAQNIVDGDYMFPQIHMGTGGTVQFYFNGRHMYTNKKENVFDNFHLDNQHSGNMRILEIHYTQDFDDRSNRSSMFGIGSNIPPIPGVLYPGSACAFRGTYSYTGKVKQPIRARLLRQYSETADRADKARVVDLGTPNAVNDRVNITVRVLATTVLLLVSYAKEPVSFDNHADTSNMKVSFDNVIIWDAYIDTGSYIHKFWVGN